MVVRSAAQQRVSNHGPRASGSTAVVIGKLAKPRRD